MCKSGSGCGHCDAKRLSGDSANTISISRGGLPPEPAPRSNHPGDKCYSGNATKPETVKPDTVKPETVFNQPRARKASARMGTTFVSSPEGKAAIAQAYGFRRNVTAVITSQGLMFVD